MKKLFKSKTFNKDTYEAIKKHKKWLKYRSFLLAFFILGVNIFAWFIYITKANFSLQASIVSWDVNFYDGATQINNLIVNVDDLYPGMPTFEKKILVTNASDLKANFNYTIEEVMIMGENVIPSGYTNDQIVELLKKDYPFSFNFSSSKNSLDVQDSLDFIVNIDWEYESDSVKYYKLNNFYTYDPSVVYYQYINDNYVEALVTEENFETLKLSLYLEKDDADSFYGSECKNYKKDTGLSCVQLKLVLDVEQSL